MFNTEKFIILIHDQPSIWDKGAKEYSDRNARERSWIQISDQMTEGWSELTPEEQRKEVDKLRNKWRHLRDAFLRSLNTKRGKLKRTKKYVYADMLSFLLTSGEERSTSGNIDTENKIGNEEEVKMEETLTDPIHISPSNFQSADSREAKSRQPANKSTLQKSHMSPKNNRRKPITPFQSALLKKLDKSHSCERPTVREENDPDKMFLLSLLDDYKKLSDSDKLDFKLTMLQFLKQRQQRVPPSHSFSNSVLHYSPMSNNHYAQFLHSLSGCSHPFSPYQQSLNSPSNSSNQLFNYQNSPASYTSNAANNFSSHQIQSYSCPTSPNDTDLSHPLSPNTS